jgi:hypothetical protein
MISRQELNPKGYALTPEQTQNQATLLVAINVIRTAWGKPMTVTSGVRSPEDQWNINPGAPQSKHLLGAACDILDRDGALAAWVTANESLLAKAALWCEDTRYTKGWVHFQCLPPKSGKRFFVP